MEARALTPVHFETYAAKLLDRYDTLEVKADGSVYLVRSEKAETARDIREVCADYERGDEVRITQHASFYTVEVRRLLYPSIDAG